MERYRLRGICIRQEVLVPLDGLSSYVIRRRALYKRLLYFFYRIGK